MEVSRNLSANTHIVTKFAKIHLVKAIGDCWLIAIEYAVLEPMQENACATLWVLLSVYPYGFDTLWCGRFPSLYVFAFHS